MQGRRNRYFFGAAVLGLALAAGGGCDRVREAKDRVRAEREREEEAAAVRPEAMELRTLGADGTEGTLDTAEFGGGPWLLLAFRSDDPVCRAAAAGEWNALAADARASGGRLLAVLTDVEAAGRGKDGTPWTGGAREVAASAAFPACAATRAQLDALKGRAPMEVNPAAYLFDGEGRLVRTTAGHVRPEHHAEDMAALAAGRELPEHPAQGVLPEDNAP